MPQQTHLSPDSIEWSAKADDALEEARGMPPGPERTEALKKAGLLRNAADVYGIIFAAKGRPPK
jgi:hypothetical protein